MAQETLIPPNYVRAVILINSMAIPSNVKLTFLSGAIEDHILLPGEEHKYEGEFNKGGESLVDPVTKLEVTASTFTTTEKLVASGIEILRYNISGSITLSPITPVK
ncbi:hypothetical protein LOD99_72 [Oopsacas minuta]|uniref:Uncharacterized protein n=1 Tax=Oopsacas minuta TaxID=111878 RepID=A0AAV7K980_9METZ|nr:hypothetical protein LOD99_71 [Oopsacas minuta]KAI6657324.1 hypothetical protein LOD99_72 [Oopsacas minuta]